MNIHTEQTFESAIEQDLLGNGGYVKGDPNDISRELSLDCSTIIQFLRKSQNKEWNKLSDIHGYDIDNKIIARLTKELDLRGSLDVLRHGFTDYGVHFDMAYFKPESGLNPDSQFLYDSNILTVYRQVHYSKKNENSLDLVLGINGIPVATAELKNPFTGQNVEHAKKQYMADRDQVIWQTEVDNFAKVFFQQNYNPKNQSKLYAYIDPALERFLQLPKEKSEGELSQEDIRGAMVSFTRLYGYLTQIMPFYDSELEKLYPYLRLFLSKLPKGTIDPRLILDDKVTLEYYRIEKLGQKVLSLVKEDSELAGITEAGIKRKTEEDKAPLSEIIKLINDRLGTDFEEADRLVFEQVVEDCVADEQLKQQAQANSFENFKFPFKDVYQDKVIDRMEQNTEICNRMIAGGEVADVIFNWVMKEVYSRLKEVQKT